MSPCDSLLPACRSACLRYGVGLQQGLTSRSRSACRQEPHAGICVRSSLSSVAAGSIRDAESAGTQAFAHLPLAAQSQEAPALWPARRGETLQRLSQYGSKLDETGPSSRPGRQAHLSRRHPQRVSPAKERRRPKSLPSRGVVLRALQSPPFPHRPIGLFPVPNFSCRDAFMALPRMRQAQCNLLQTFRL